MVSLPCVVEERTASASPEESAPPSFALLPGLAGRCSGDASLREDKQNEDIGTRICVTVIPGDHWSTLPRNICRVIIRDSLLLEPSPAACNGRTIYLSALSSKALAIFDSPQQSNHESGKKDTQGIVRKVPLMSAPLAVAATRWRDVMEDLFVNGDPVTTALHVARLRRITLDGKQRAPPDTLAEVWPELGELMRDGGNGLLSLPELPQIYAALTRAFACSCCSEWSLSITRQDTGYVPGDMRNSITAKELQMAYREICKLRSTAFNEAMRVMWQAEATKDHKAIERACDEVTVLNPCVPEPYLVRAGVHLHNYEAWKCIEDVRMYLWWSTRHGYDPGQHATAYWRMAEAFLMELDQRCQKMGALLEDDVFHCLADEAEASLRLSIRFAGGTDLYRDGSAGRHLLQRIEAHRATRRTAAALLDAPLLTEASSATSSAPLGNIDPNSKDYALPWPLDLCAGLPDIALFARLPTGSGIQSASHQDHDPLDLLFLDSWNPLDLFTTLGSLSVRGRAFAMRNPEMLHWKHRPKPVKLHLQMSGVERLAHTLICLLIAKQVGTVTSSQDDKVARKPTGYTQSASAKKNAAGAPPPTFTMEETHYDRFLSGLLSALIFCRVLTIAQRAELDRLLTLLVYSSMDIAWIRRTFPWLDLDDNRLSDLVVDEDTAENEHEDSHEHDGRRSFGLGDTQKTRDSFGRTPRTSGYGLHKVVGVGHNCTGRGWGSSLLLFHLQQIWLGWLSTAPGETATTACNAKNAGSHRKSLDLEGIHVAARELLLGARSAALCPALDLAGQFRQHPTQRKLWALTGHFPTVSASPSSSIAHQKGHSAEKADCRKDEVMGTATLSQDDDDDPDPAVRLVPADARTRWQPMLEELASTSAREWRPNPCVLDPFSWELEPRNLVDPFSVLSWQLRQREKTNGDSEKVSGDDASGSNRTTWADFPGKLLDVADPLLPPAKGTEPLVAEIVWETVIGLLKSLSTIFHALEAAESAKTRAPAPKESPLAASSDDGLRSTLRSTVGQEFSEASGPLRSRRARSQRADQSHSMSRGRLGIRDKVAALRKQMEEDAGDRRHSADDITQHEINNELQELKKRRHAEQLETMLRDYVRLDFVRKREADWWARGHSGSVAYKEAIDAGAAATWNPAPAACAPLQLRIRMSAGTPWQVVRAASFRRVSYDAIDARTMLCSDVGLLGICTWFESVLKGTTHAYIQTRHCEELFLDKLRKEFDGDQKGHGRFAAGAPPTGNDIKIPPRSSAQLAAAGSSWPYANPKGSTSRGGRPVLADNGLARWPHARNPLQKSAMYPPPSRLQHHRAEGVPITPRQTSPSECHPSKQDFQKTQATLDNIADKDTDLVINALVNDALRGIYLVAVSNVEFLQGGPKAILQPVYRRAIASIVGAPLLAQDEAENEIYLKSELPFFSQLPLRHKPTLQRSSNKKFQQQAHLKNHQNLKHSPVHEKPRPVPPYSVESMLFEQLVHESISTRVNAAQMQYLLGVAVRAEPLWAEPSLGSLGACSLPVRNNFFPWDSTLEAVKTSVKNWPCAPEHWDTNSTPPPIAPGVGGGLINGYEKSQTCEIGKPSMDPLAGFSKFWHVPNDRIKAEALGPRLLRIRKLGGHPSLSLTPSGRCANAAFCCRPAIMPEDTTVGGPGPFKCMQCECAWYCSAACQSLHTGAHSFECQGLRALRAAANGFESRGLERTKRGLAALLEHVLAKQFSMVGKIEAQVGATALSQDLLTAVYGSADAITPLQNAMSTDVDSDPESDNDARTSQMAGSDRTSNKEADEMGPKALQNTKLIHQGRMVVVPEDFRQWSVQLQVGALEAADSRSGSKMRKMSSGAFDDSTTPAGRSSMQCTVAGLLGRGSIVGHHCDAAAGFDMSINEKDAARPLPKELFDVKRTYAHTAAAVVRLLLRWIGTQQRSLALREVIDDGFIFCLLSGLCETRHFSKRRLTKHGVVSILAHRMSLHVAASQQWRALSASLAPPKQFQEDGLQGIECAQYSAYYAFLRPLRLPFCRLKPFLPIICVAWGAIAKQAVLALPHKDHEQGISNNTPRKSAVLSPSSPATSRSSPASPRTFRTSGRNTALQDDLDGLMHSSEVVAKTSTWKANRDPRDLTTFLDVASEHLANIQLVDSVNMDVLTGKAVFLMYVAEVDAAKAPDLDVNDEPCVILLDAARGMQAVASPVPVRELRRCAL